MPALWLLSADVWIFAVGGLIFCLLCALIIKALPQPKSGFLQVLLGPLNLLTSAGLKAAQRIVSVFAPAAYAPQQHVGAALHDTARLVDDTAAVITDQSAIIAQLAEVVAGTLPAGEIGKAIDRLNKRIGTAEQQARGIGADVLPRVQALEKGIGADVLPQIRSLDKELARVEHHELPAIRAREKALEHGAIDTWKWIRTHPLSLATAAFAGAVAVALGRLGGGWIRCKNWNRIGKSVCGLPLGLIESILGDLIDVLLIADVCQITKLMIGVAEGPVVQDALRGIIDGVDELMLCQGVELPAPLDGYATDLPPAQPYSLLPAA